ASGRLIAASFGRERGVTALDSILLVLSEGDFSFLEGQFVAEGESDLDLDLQELAARAATLPERYRSMAEAIPSPAAVPHIVPMGGPSYDSTQVALRLGTLYTLLAINGERSVQDLSQHSASAHVLGDLAILLDFGLIDFNGHASLAGQPVA